jgi:hypothetical protein
MKRLPELQADFRECARLVEALRWRDVERICGSEVRAFTKQTREAFARLQSRAIPRRLRVGSFTVIAARRRVSTVEGMTAATASSCRTGCSPRSTTSTGHSRRRMRCTRLEQRPASPSVVTRAVRRGERAGDTDQLDTTS